MGKYYCDYCDVFLTHDSASVRRAHNAGRNHLTNVKEYYASLGSDKAQDIIDQITRMAERGPPPAGVAAPSFAGALPPPPMPAPMRFPGAPAPPGFPGGPPPGFPAPPPGFVPPPGMPPPPGFRPPPPGFFPPGMSMPPPGMSPPMATGGAPPVGAKPAAKLINGMSEERARMLGMI